VNRAWPILICKLGSHPKTNVVNKLRNARDTTTDDQAGQLQQAIGWLLDVDQGALGIRQ